MWTTRFLAGSLEDVTRMRGERTSEGYTGTVAKILAKGAMTIKFMAVTGSDDSHEEEQLGGKCLGVGYRMSEDQLHFRLDPCFYEGKAKSADQARELVRLGKQEVALLQSGALKFYKEAGAVDGHGLVRPTRPCGSALVTGKLLLRRLYSPARSPAGTRTCPR